MKKTGKTNNKITRTFARKLAEDGSLDFLISLVFPENLKIDEQWRDYAGYINHVFALLENQLDLLLVSYFLKSFHSKPAQEMKNEILSNLNFHRKLEAAYTLELINGKTKKRISELNNFRIAVAHYKWYNKKFSATEKNIKRVRFLAKKLMPTLTAELIEQNNNLKKMIVKKFDNALGFLGES